MKRRTRWYRVRRALWREVEDRREARRRKDRERREQAAAWVPRPGTRYG